MKNKKLSILSFASLSMMCLGILTSCNNNSRPKHEHVFENIEAVEETCISDGVKAHKECIYCGAAFIDGKQVEEKEVIIPKSDKKHHKEEIPEVPATCIAQGVAAHAKCDICDQLFVDDKVIEEAKLTLAINPNNHHLVDCEEVPAKCLETGLKAHTKCDYCGKLFVNGNEVEEKDLLISATGSHTWIDGEIKCQDCDAYKTLYEGQYYIIDYTSTVPFGNCMVDGAISNSHDSTASTKNAHLTSILTNPNTFATQAGAATTIENNGKVWKIKDNTGGTFTRFNVGVNGETYVGKFILSIDMKVTNEVEIQRFGVKIVNSTGGALFAQNQPKLIGTNSGEENNPNRQFTPNTNYRFTYVFETTAVDQLLQIFTVTGAKTDVELSNIHVIPLEGKNNVVEGKMLYFGEASNALIKKEDCAHNYKYSVSAKESSCETDGLLAHDHCPVCGNNYINGELTNSIIASHLGHDYGELVSATASTCSTHGHEAYYQCARCNQYFDANKEPLEALPELPLLSHTPGEWITNSEEHYKECSVCHEQILKGAHIPGPAATEDTPQTCTECGYVIKEAIGHTHVASALVPAKDATCGKNGHVAYYECTTCHHYFSDAACENEIADIIIPGGHIMSDLVAAKDATCTNDGNLAYYHCERCNKFFEDKEGTKDITGTYLITKKGHTIEFHEEVVPTCLEVGNVAYAYCSTCDKYFTSAEATTELASNSIFSTKKHNFVDGVCADCGLTQLTFNTNEQSFGTKGADMNPVLKENPGTWALQSGKNLTCSKDEANNTLIADSKAVSKASNRNAFMRFIPAVDGVAYVGKYLISFDFTVQSATDKNIAKANLTVGFCVQGVGVSGNIATADDHVTEFEIGKTYRFAALIETKNDSEFMQFNIRNLQKYGTKVVISNPAIQYLDDTPATTTTIASKVFGVETK